MRNYTCALKEDLKIYFKGVTANNKHIKVFENAPIISVKFNYKMFPEKSGDGRASGWASSVSLKCLLNKDYLDALSQLKSCHQLILCKSIGDNFTEELPIKEFSVENKANINDELLIDHLKFIVC